MIKNLCFLHIFRDKFALMHGYAQLTGFMCIYITIQNHMVGIGKPTNLVGKPTLWLMSF